MNGTETLAIIPARGGSKGIPRKNVREVAGKPLIGYSIEQGLASDRVDRVVVSSEDEEIKDTAREFGAEVVERPAELATDEAPILPVLKHVVSTVDDEPDFVILLQPTSPLRTVEDINTAVEMLAQNDFDSVTTVSRAGFHPNCLVRVDDGEPSHVLQRRPATRRQDVEELYVIDGMVYAYETPSLMALEERSWCENNGVVVTAPERAIDIDEEYELEIADCLLRKR